MFKNRSVQLKVVKDTPQETATEPKRRLAEDDIQAVKSIAKIVGTYILARVAINAALTAYTTKNDKEDNK